MAVQQEHRISKSAQKFSIIAGRSAEEIYKTCRKRQKQDKNEGK